MMHRNFAVLHIAHYLAKEGVGQVAKVVWCKLEKGDHLRAGQLLHKQSAVCPTPEIKKQAS